MKGDGLSQRDGYARRFSQSAKAGGEAYSILLSYPYTLYPIPEILEWYEYLKICE
jgi:hypothetical protein